MIRPFGAYLRVFDPYVADLPEGCMRVDSLRELFAASSIIVVHAGQSDETRGTVSKEMLALLPDGGIVINTARGGIIDQDALFAELATGRLRAGLDVLDGPHGDALPPEHPARQLENLLLTAHSVSASRWGGVNTQEKLMQDVCLDNIRRFLRGDALRFIMSKERYLRST